MGDKILKVNLFNIEDDARLSSINKQEADEYVRSIINKGIKNINVRYFKTKRESTEVIGIINNLIKNTIIDKITAVAATIEDDCDNIFDIETKKIALRLLESEALAQQKISRMDREIKKGSLIQAVIEKEDGLLAYVLAKIEHVNILDKNDWEKHTGLPLDKEILKTCVISYDEIGEIIEIRVFDSNNTIADYWKDGLLELEPLTSDEANTKKSLTEVCKFLRNSIKSKSPADYTNLYNSVLGYYDQNKGFDYDDMIEKVFLNYTPFDQEKINMSDYREKLNNLPNNKFDRRFDVIPSAIRNKKIRTYSIGEEIELKLKDSIKNLSDVIKAERDYD